MAIFPKISSPCPYIDKFDTIMDGDMCKMCKKEVHDLSGMDDDEKRAFFAACEGDVCVSYTLPLKHAIAAAALMGSGMFVAQAAAHEAHPTATMAGGKHAHFEQVIEIPAETSGDPEAADTDTEETKPTETGSDDAVTDVLDDYQYQIAGGIRAHDPADFIVVEEDGQSKPPKAEPKH